MRRKRGRDKTPPFLTSARKAYPPGNSGWDTARERSVDTATRNPLLSLKLLCGLFLLRAEQPLWVLPSTSATAIDGRLLRTPGL